MILLKEKAKVKEGYARLDFKKVMKEDFIATEVRIFMHQFNHEEILRVTKTARGEFALCEHGEHSGWYALSYLDGKNELCFPFQKIGFSLFADGDVLHFQNEWFSGWARIPGLQRMAGSLV